MNYKSFVIEEPDQNESLLAQSMANVDLLLALCEEKFLESTYFNNLTAINEYSKDILKASNIVNPSCIQMLLYSLLVLPKEILTEKIYENLENDYLDINIKIEELLEKESTESNYILDRQYKVKNKNRVHMDYIRHIRNAVSHSSCEFEYDENGKSSFIIFKDKYYNKKINKLEKCSIKIESYKVFGIIEYLKNLSYKVLLSRSDFLSY